MGDDQKTKAVGPPNASAPPPAPVVNPPAKTSRAAIRCFGDYALLGKIAEGGMGVVYRARQISLNKKVALKMIKGGQLNATATVRFRTEAEAMGQLDHPHIVPIYEVGEHEGQQYFSMRLIDGPDLAQEIAGKPLLPRRAAEILGTVARAVHHAHQRGVLHRDLKPSNILLEETDTGPAVPNVTDFGLAKLLERQHLRGQTASVAIMGTLEYMAPEQAEGKAKNLTTAADIYSLGAILYAMLAGRPPFQAQPDEQGEGGHLPLLRRVVETEPQRPRTLNPQVDCDLETICLKCLEKDPRRRYGSADALAEDLDRYLRHEPILARPSTVWIRAAKWARRKPAVAALAAVLALTTVGGVTTVLWLLQRSRAELARSRQTSLFLRDMLAGVKPSVALGQDTAMLRTILEKAEARMDRYLHDQPEVEAPLRRTLGEVYYDLASYDRASTNLHRSLVLQKRIHGEYHSTVCKLLGVLGSVLLKQGRIEEAENTLQASLAMQTQLRGDDRVERAWVLEKIGAVYLEKGKLTSAVRVFEEALDLRRQAGITNSTEIAAAAQNLGAALWELRRYEEAESLLREALALRQQALSAVHPDVAKSLSDLASLRRSRGDAIEAESLQRRVLDIYRALHPDAHPDKVNALGKLALYLEDQRREEEAETLHREALQMAQVLFPEGNPKVAWALQGMADHLRARGRHNEAESYYRQAIGLLQEKFPALKPQLVKILNNLALIMENTGRLSEAEDIWLEILTRHANDLEASHPDIARFHYNLACVSESRSNPKQAEAEYRAALPGYRALGTNDGDMTSIVLRKLGSLLQKQQREDEAEALFREALALRVQRYGPLHEKVIAARESCARLYRQQRRYPEAEPIYRQMLDEWTRILGSQHSNTVKAMSGVASILMAQKEYSAAEPYWSNAVTLWRLAAPQEKTTEADWLRNWGMTQIGQRHYADALRQYERAFAIETAADTISQDSLRETVEQILALYEAQARTNRTSAKLPREVGEAQKQFVIELRQMAKTALDSRRHARATAFASQATDCFSRLVTNYWRAYDARSLLGACLLGQKKLDEVGPHLLAGYEGLVKTQDRISMPGKTPLRESIQRIVEFYQATGDDARVEEFKQKLAEFDRKGNAPPDDGREDGK